MSSDDGVMASKAFFHVLLVVTFGLVLVTGLGGIDYGTHWDER